jgi:uncharacterized protein involved in exopolysaccharide biosynthesis
MRRHRSTLDRAIFPLVLLRHKRKIIALTLLGVLAATGFCFTRPPLYQSQAKIFIRYETVGPVPDPAVFKTPHTTSLTNRTVMDLEIEILTSYDLAAKVATNLGPEKILAQLGGGNKPAAAARALRKHLKVEPMSRESMIRVTFFHPDAVLVQPVLSEIIAGYLAKHAMAHSLKISDRTLQDKLQELRLELSQRENELRMAKTNGDVNAAEAVISDLERKRRIQEDNFLLFTTMLERSRIEEQSGLHSSVSIRVSKSLPFRAASAK